MNNIKTTLEIIINNNNENNTALLIIIIFLTYKYSYFERFGLGLNSVRQRINVLPKKSRHSAISA